MKRFLLSLILCVCLAQGTLYARQSPAIADVLAVRERLSLDNGWRFYKGDIPFPVVRGHGMSYTNAKAGKAFGAAAPDYDDTGWRLLNLPHDWAVEGGFDQNENLSQGYRARGIGWYRRNFKLDAADRGKHLELQFDGVATHCTVWVNGTIVHRNWCGYTSFYIDVTPFVKYGEELNSLVVRVDANDQEGWWYEGAGIYRHTWLVKRSAVHIATDGVFAQPVKNTHGEWTIPASVQLQNAGRTDAPVEVAVSVTDKAGKQVATAKATTTVHALGESMANLFLPVSNPELWSLEHPVCYQVKTLLTLQGQPADEVITTCGFRTIRFDADSGFFLNDQQVKIQGVCNHQDHAGVGVAVPSSLWEFRLRKLKEMGANGYRCAHNPPAAEFLEACDTLGMLVMDENRNFNASPEYVRQLQWLIRRDRNHPSVILWSVFNEEPMQGTEIGYEMVRRMRNEVKKLDTTRPVTAAMNGGQFAPVNVSQTVDVVGFNYSSYDYDRFHKANPALPMTSSEDVSGLMVRGEYVTDTARHLLDAYDTQVPSWGSTHRDAWKAIAERPYLAGCFIWTGFDYRGEPTPYDWPTAGSNFGIMDQCGFPKTAFYLHQAQWLHNRPLLQLVPHWNWPVDSIGKKIKVMALSNVQKVKLLLNGKPVGEQTVDPYEMATWSVPYQPGKLEAIGYNKGKEVARFVVETTGQPVRLQLVPDRSFLAGDGRDALPVTVQVLDAKGRPVPTAQTPVSFEISGPAALIGVANGDPNSHELEKVPHRSLFNGLAQVIVQSTEGGAGPVVLTAKAHGVVQASITLQVRTTAALPAVAVVNPFLVLDKWRVSPVTAAKPDPNQALSDNDMNSWVPTRPGELQDFSNGTYAVYRTTFKPYIGQQKEGGTIILKALTGKAEIWLNRQLVYTKTSYGKEEVTIDLPASSGSSHTLSVLVEGEKGTKAGLGGVATVVAR